MNTLFSVIIPTFRDGHTLQNCLEALSEQTLPADRFEIIVANNDPADPPRLHPGMINVRIVDEARPGSYAARNAALSVARGRYLAFTDSDCVPDRDWLEAGWRALEARPGARVAGSVPIFREPGTSRFAYLYEFHTAFRQDEYVGRGVCATANLLVSRETFDAVGRFNDHFLSGGDFDWNHRAQDLGIPIFYHEEIRVRHPARKRLGDIFRKRRRTARSEAVSGRHGMRHYIPHLLAPPFGRTRFDRGHSSALDKIQVFCLQWTLGIYAAFQFMAVRFGLTKPVRS